MEIDLTQAVAHGMPCAVLTDFRKQLALIWLDQNYPLKDKVTQDLEKAKDKGFAHVFVYEVQESLEEQPRQEFADAYGVTAESVLVPYFRKEYDEETVQEAEKKVVGFIQMQAINGGSYHHKFNNK